MAKQPRSRRLWRRKTDRVWSIKTITIVALIATTLTATSVFLFGKRSVFFETELTLALVAAGLFVFLAVGLYRGVRVRRWDLPGTEVKEVSMDGIEDVVSNGVSEGVSAADDPIRAIVAIVLGIVIGILLVLLLWILLNVGIVLWVFLLAATSWVFYRALRQVFAKSRRCRGRLALSLGYALMYAALYTGWLFALIIIAEALFDSRIAKV